MVLMAITASSVAHATEIQQYVRNRTPSVWYGWQVLLTNAAYVVGSADVYKEHTDGTTPPDWIITLIKDDQGIDRGFQAWTDETNPDPVLYYERLYVYYQFATDEGVVDSVINSQAPMIPEPSSLAGLFMGACATVGWALRRRVR